MKKQRADATADRRQLQKEQTELDQQRESQEAVELKQKNDHKLLQQIILLLAQRLQVLMALFETEPVPGLDQPQGAPNSESKILAATANAAAKTASDDIDSWREMQQKWEALRQELEDVDWNLENTRSQLAALHLEYLGNSLASPDGKQQSSQSSLLSGFHGPNPFSDAVAAGRDTVPVAEELKANRLLRRLSCPGNSLECRARQVKGASPP